MLTYEQLLHTTQEQMPDADPKTQRQAALQALVQLGKTQEKSLLACLWDIYRNQDWVEEDTEYPNFNHYVHKLFPDDYWRVKTATEIVQGFLAEVQVLNMEGLLSRVVLPDTGEIVEVTPQFLLDRPEMLSRLLLSTRAFSKLTKPSVLAPTVMPVEEAEYPETAVSPETQTPLPTGIKKAEAKLQIISDMLAAPNRENFINRLEEKGFKEHRFSETRIPCRTFASAAQAAEELPQVEGTGSVVVLYNLDNAMLDIINHQLKRYLETYG